MKQPTELEQLKRDRETDAEWLGKYKKIVAGLQQIAEIMFDSCVDQIDEWSAIYGGLNTLSKLIQEDLDGRKDAK